VIQITYGILIYNNVDLLPQMTSHWRQNQSSEMEKW